MKDQSYVVGGARSSSSGGYKKRPRSPSPTPAQKLRSLQKAAKKEQEEDSTRPITPTGVGEKEKYFDTLEGEGRTQEQLSSAVRARERRARDLEHLQLQLFKKTTAEGAKQLQGEDIAYQYEVS